MYDDDDDNVKENEIEIEGFFLRLRLNSLKKIYSLYTDLWSKIYQLITIARVRTALSHVRAAFKSCMRIMA